MTFDAHHATFFGKCHEISLFVLVFFGHYEANVHDGAVFFYGCSHKHFIAVNFIVKQIGFLHVEFMHGFHAAQVFDPFQCFVHYENRKYRRSIEHGIVFWSFANVGSVIHHSLQFAVCLAQNILPYNYKCNSGRTHIFLCSTVNKCIFAYIHRPRHDIGRHIGHQRNGTGYIFMNFSSVDGIVGCDVEIINIGGNGVTFGNVGVIFIFGRCHHFYFAVEFGFLDGFLSPYTCLQISCLFVQQVGRQVKELSGSAAAQKQNRIFIRDVEQVSPQLFGFGHNPLPTGCAVRNFKNSDTCSIKIANSFNSRFNSRFGQNTWSCIKIMFFHT